MRQLSLQKSTLKNVNKMVVGKTEGVNYNPLENVTIIYSWEVFLHLGSLRLFFRRIFPNYSIDLQFPLDRSK